jgi:GAF domain-containing protein
VGAAQLSQEHSLDIGGLSVIGRVTLRGEPLLIPDLRRDPIHKVHPLLPDMRCELALPLVLRDETVGAIDLQSRQPNLFSAADVSTLQAVASLIAMGLDGLQLHETSQRNQRENHALVQQTQANLREIERLNYQLTGRAWTDYLRLQADSTAMTVDFESGQLQREADWTATLNEAVAQHNVVTETEAGRQVVALPIIVRNETIGAMEFEMDAADRLPDGAIELISAVGQRLGLAMENRRLFDETQKVAQREALINDIGAKLQAASGVDAILQQAAHHLQEALSAHQVTIRLGIPEQRPAGEKVKA